MSFALTYLKGSDLPDQELAAAFVLHHFPTAFIQALCLGEVLMQQSFWDPLANPPVWCTYSAQVILLLWGHRNYQASKRKCILSFKMKIF